jgi:hypothetical protein
MDDYPFDKELRGVDAVPMIAFLSLPLLSSKPYKAYNLFQFSFRTLKLVLRTIRIRMAQGDADDDPALISIPHWVRLKT